MDEQKGLKEDIAIVQESIHKNDEDSSFGEEFYPGEEETLAARGELLPEELQSIKKWTKFNTEKISTVRECGVHPSSKHSVYNSDPKPSSSNAIYSGGHNDPFSLIGVIQDDQELLQDDHQLIDELEGRKNEQCKKTAEHLVPKEEDEYYYEDHLDLITDSDVYTQGLHAKLTVSISTRTVLSLTSVLSPLSVGSSWEFLSHQGL